MGQGGNAWRQKEDGVWWWWTSVPSPNLSKRRKARKCRRDPVKRRKEPALQMGKESVPNLPALATAPSEEINQDCFREGERAGMLPKGSQCSPQTSSQSQQLQSSQGNVTILPSRVWGQVQGPVTLMNPALCLWVQTQGPRQRAGG